MFDYYLYLILKFVVGLFILIFYLNFTGKTQLSQMTPIDFVGNFVLGGVIGGVIYNDTIPMTQYICVLLIGIALITTLNSITKHFEFFRTVALGEPIPIIKDGKFLTTNIQEKKNKIDIISVASRLHAKGIASFDQISYAQIEPSGEITVVIKGEKMLSAVIMAHGKPRLSALAHIERDEEWLNKLLEVNNFNKDEIFLVEAAGNNIYVTMNDGTTNIIDQDIAGD